MADGYDDQLVEDSGENAPVGYTQPAGDDSAASNDLASQAGVQDVGTGDPALDQAAGSMPESEDPEQKKEERGWLRKLLDDVREAYGINDEPSVDPMSGAELPGDPNAHEPAGLPEQAGGSDGEEHETAGLPQQVPDESKPEVQKQEDFADPMSGLPMGEDKTPPKDPKDMGLGELIGAAGKKAVSSAVEGVRRVATAGVGQEAGPLQGMAERALRSYVTGDGGLPKEERDARVQKVAGAVPQTNLSVAKMMALQEAQKNDPDKGVSHLQGDRKEYVQGRALASAAFDAGDKDGSAQLFNKAQTNVGTGEHVTMVPTSKGMDAHIEMPDGKTVNVPLTDNQYRELLHMRVGDFDHMSERGIVQNLQDLTKTAGLDKGHESYAGKQEQPAEGGVPTPQPRPAEAGATSQAGGVPAPASQSGVDRMRAAMTPANTSGIGTAGNNVPPGWSAGERQGGGQQGSTLRRDSGHDPDGWPTGIPRGGQFANTKGTATRDFSEPVRLGKSGHVAGVGRAGSMPVYDVDHRTYMVGKDGLPVAQEGQPGFRGPQRGQPGWNGIDGGGGPQPWKPAPAIRGGASVPPPDSDRSNAANAARAFPTAAQSGQRGAYERGLSYQDRQEALKREEIKSKTDINTAREEGRRENWQMRNEGQNYRADQRNETSRYGIDKRSGDKQVDQELRGRDLDRKDKAEARHNITDERKAADAAEKNGNTMFKTLVGEAHDLRKEGQKVPPGIQELINQGVERYKSGQGPVTTRPSGGGQVPPGQPGVNQAQPKYEYKVINGVRMQRRVE